MDIVRHGLNDFLGIRFRQGNKDYHSQQTGFEEGVIAVFHMITIDKLSCVWAGMRDDKAVSRI